jgi:hypothetical protein
MERDQIADEQIHEAVKDVVQMLVYKFEQHGKGAAVSMHEAFGVMQEEMTELEDEMRANSQKKFRREAIDVAVAALWAIASL